MAVPPPTERLTFREMHEADLDLMAGLLGDARVMWVYPRPWTRDEIARWIRRAESEYRERGFGLWIVEERETGAFVGECGLTQQVFGTAARPAAMPMDAWQEDGEFVVAFDLPGVKLNSLDLNVERNVLTVRAERQDPTQPNVELVASERPRGVFSRQLILGDTLNTDNIKASYDQGVLTLRIPVAEQAKPRKIEIETQQSQMHHIGT